MTFIHRYRHHELELRIWLPLVLGAVVVLQPGFAIAGSNNPLAPTKQSVLTHLNSLSLQLIHKVKHGNAEATAFRTNVVYYRESLRSLMLANEKRHKHKLADSLLMQMVRMAALLQSAAECHTGRYITCPANLMHELDQQQQQLNLALTAAPSSP